MKTILQSALLCRAKWQCFALTYLTVMCLSIIKVSAQCPTGTCSTTINTTNSSNLTVASGQVICVVSGGSLTGSVTINAGGQINLMGGAISSSSLTINGTIVLASGTFNANNVSLNAGGIICNGTSFTFPLNNWNFNGGTFNNYGTYAQGLSSIPTGAIFNNFSRALLNPTNSINTFQGTINNYGNADFSYSLSVSNNGKFDNFGTTHFRQSFNWNGAFALINEVGAVMTFDQNLNIAGSSTYNNRGKTYVNANFEIGNNSTFNNTGRIEVTGASTYDGIVNNTGFVLNNGPSGSSIININSGSIVHNSCRFITTAGFNNNSPNTVNDGLIWVLNNPGNNPDVQINQTFTQTVNGLLRGTNFVNQSLVAGNGNYYFTGNTLNQGTFGSGSDAPNFYDVSNTPTASNRGFDNQNPNTNVAVGETHNAFTPADTTNYTNGCNNDFLGTTTAIDSSRSSVAYPTINPLTIPIGSFTGTSLSGGIQNGTITKLIFTALPANCGYIIINGTQYGLGGIAFPAAGVTVTIVGASSNITLALLPTAAIAGKIIVPFKVMNSQGATSSNTANLTQPFSAVLPVTFGNISASSTNCTININFETLTEQNNKAFIIEYGTDGNTWIAIATIASKGDAAFKQSYSFMHTSAVTGGNYYRIKQIDKDGNSTYSSTLYVNNNCTSAFTSVTSYPNPIKDYVTVSFPNTVGQKTIKIVDILGRILQTITTTGNVVNLSTSNLISGIYGLEVIADGKKIYAQKLLKQ